MNGAARCGRQRCQVLARSGCKGWGPERQGLPGSSVSPSGTRAGAWGREPPAPHGAGFSALPLPGPAPAAVGSAAPGGARPRCGGRRAPAPGSPSPLRPSCPWVWGPRGSSAGTGLAGEREKRSAPRRFCKIAVTTPPGVWVGNGKNRTEREPKSGLSWGHPPPPPLQLPAFSIAHCVFTGEPSHILI